MTTINELIKKYEDKINWCKCQISANTYEIEMNDNLLKSEVKNYKEFNIALRNKIRDFEETLQDLKELKESTINKELEYHKQLQDEKKGDIYTKIDNAFIDGKRFSIKEIIGE